MIKKITDYLAAHPWLYGLLQAIEAAMVGALTSIMTDWATGGYTWDKAGLTKMGAFVMASIGLAVRNYIKQAPRKEWTPEQREEKTGVTNA